MPPPKASGVATRAAEICSRTRGSSASRREISSTTISSAPQRSRFRRAVTMPPAGRHERYPYDFTTRPSRTQRTPMIRLKAMVVPQDVAHQQPARLLALLRVKLDAAEPIREEQGRHVRL